MMRRGVVSVIVFFAAVAAEAQQATFQNPSRFGISGSTSDATGLMVLEDVGSRQGPPDGILDILTAGEDSRISLLYGRGNGTFASGVTTNIGRIPRGFAVALADGDNIKDALIADAGSQLTCFHGFDDGSAYELAGGPFAVLRNPVGIEVDDLNGDQLLDVVVVSEGDQAGGGITILHGNGNCTFSVPPPPADSQVMAGVASSAATIGDFNKDGRLDVAVANAFVAAPNVSILRRDASGRYSVTQTLPVGDEPVAIEAADLNNDTRLDLVVTNRNSDSVSVLLGRNDGSFAAAGSFVSGSTGSSPGGLAIGDLNLDGNRDVVVANNRSSDASVLLGDGLGGLLAPRSFVADEEPLAAAVGVLDADTAPDVVVVSRGRQGPNATILLGLGDGALVGVEDLIARPNPNGVAVGDFDNNGLTDVAVPHSDGRILLFNGVPGGFAALPPLVVDADVNGILPGDFDGNGLLDFVAVINDEASVMLFAAVPGEGFGDGTSVAVGGPATTGLPVDLNGDGLTDVAIIRAAGTSDAVDVLLADGQGGFAPPASYPVGETSVEVDFGDCNNDGRVDLFVANNASASVSLLLGTGGGVLNPVGPRLIEGAPKSIAVADFDRDGFDDFAVALTMSSSVLLYYGNGSCLFAREQQTLMGGGSPSGLAARDFSGDGIPDLLVGNDVSNSVTLFTKIPGARLFQRLQNDEVPASRRPIAVEAGDFDGDGRYDGAAANSFVAGTVSILTNILAPPAFRGDGNSDARITAADLAASMREFTDGGSPRVEEAPRAGFVAGPGIDANGDGLVSGQDPIAVASRIFDL